MTYTISASQSYQDKMVCATDVVSWHLATRTEQPLRNYPRFSWALITSADGETPVLSKTSTISRPPDSAVPEGQKIFPYGDKPALLAEIKELDYPAQVRDAYTLSALRFRLFPFQDERSHEENKHNGVPSVLRPLYIQKASAKSNGVDESWLQLPSLQTLEAAIKTRQSEMRSLYRQELAPLMNANPLDPTRYCQGLSPELVHDLERYVELQNRPYLFFDLMQWLERDIAIRRWRSAQAGHPISCEQAMTYVMNSWIDRNGQRRKKSIKCPSRVPLAYMQSVRRKNQPFITQEFADHAHGAYNHWLQEHIWQRFCDRYPERCQLSPSQFFRQIGKAHFAFADAIYELHMSNVANPANTNFWTVLQFYLPLMSPWP